MLAFAVPLVFLHIDWQPTITVHAGIAPSFDLSDLAVIVTGLAALVAGLREGFGPLRSGALVGGASAAFLAMTFASVFTPLASDRAYAWRTHLVSAGKFAEYALLALSVPLLVRRRRDLDLVLGVFVAWSVAASLLALVQFFGWRVLGAYPAGRRQPSFLGHHDFAALSGGAAALAAVSIALGRTWRVPRRLAIPAGVAGVVGLVLAGATGGAIGFAAGVGAAAVVSRLRGLLTLRRLAGLAAIVAVVGAGVVGIRGRDFEDFLRFLGVRQKTTAAQAGVQTYAQHTLLAYIGWRIFLDHPAIGVGWQGSSEYSAYGPQLAAAHREFPSSSPLSFPSPERPYGVQNAFVQALADMGVVGFALLLAFFAAGLFLAGRAAFRGPPETAGPALLAGLWLLTAMGIWTALGLVAGIPLDGLTWLALGLTVAAAAGIVREQA